MDHNLRQKLILVLCCGSLIEYDREFVKCLGRFMVTFLSFCFVSLDFILTFCGSFVCIGVVESGN